MLLVVLGLQDEIEDRLGMGGTLVSLARAASAAGRVTRAVVIGGRAFQSLAAIEDRFGQMLALDDLVNALAVAEQPAGAVGALAVSWALAASMEHRSAEAKAGALGRLIEAFDPEEGLDAEFLGDARGRVAEAVRACEERLAEAGEDPYSSLEPCIESRERLGAFVSAVAGEAEDEDATEAARQTLAEAFGDFEGARLAPGWLSEALLRRLARGEPAAALHWLDVIDTALPDEKRGLFEPIRLAARHLAGAPEDRRLLDALAPDVRGVVERVLEAVAHRAAKDAAPTEGPAQEQVRRNGAWRRPPDKARPAQA